MPAFGNPCEPDWTDCPQVHRHPNSARRFMQVGRTVAAGATPQPLAHVDGRTMLAEAVDQLARVENAAMFAAAADSHQSHLLLNELAKRVTVP